MSIATALYQSLYVCSISHHADSSLLLLYTPFKSKKKEKLQFVHLFSNKKLILLSSDIYTAKTSNYIN